MLKRFIIFITVMVITIAGGWAILNRQYIRDLYIVKSTTLTPAAAQLNTDIQLTPKGDFVFRVSRPEVLSASAFNAACQSVSKEQSIVLGCYTRDRVYVYDVADARLAGVQQVTIAHEMLHAAYVRLSAAERKRVDVMVSQAAATITDPHFVDTINQYKKTEPDQINNELHSILGTEIKVLPTPLEQYYEQYFSDRSVIVAYSKGYQSQFLQIESQIAQYAAQLSALKVQIDTTSRSIAGLETQITQKQAELTTLRNSSVSAYNAQVPTFNELVRKYNVLIEQIKQQTKSYNDVVDVRNSLASTQADLTKQLDSNYQTK